MYDYIIANGAIIDGTGSAGYNGDIGIEGDRIAAIGDLTRADTRERIDARGLTVAPGFIDMHTHSDFTLLVNGAAENQVHQGVTLEAIGQCGHGCAPVSDPAAFAKTIIGYHQGVDIAWDSFEEYLAHLEKRSLGVNVVALVGHGPIYRAIKGENSSPVSPDELKKMIKLLEAALEEGAFGFTTGLEYWPGSISRLEDIVELCKVLPRYDALYATHVRNRDLFYDLGFVEALSTARVSEARLQISHIQPKFGAPTYAMDHTIDMIDRAIHCGVDVGFDVIPDVWSFTTMSSILPTWAFEGGVSKILESLSSEEVRKKLKFNPKPIWQLVKEKKWDKIALFRADHSPELVGLTFDEIGQTLNKDPHDAVFDILLKEGDNLYNATWTSQSFSDQDIILCLQQPICGVISDNIALAPYGILKDTRWSPTAYNWTARFFEHYVKTEKVLTLPEAIQRITEFPAQRLGLKRRGLLKPGYAADITIFDLNKMVDKSTLKRPNVYPEGIVNVFVNGSLELSNGERTPANGGLVIRRNSN
ncbi:MAG: amidohydrolase family protein [Deltaproteobacteria bacterium]|nr:amidohydrolase family protein [Deltaproteobacteria bacterium]